MKYIFAFLMGLFWCASASGQTFTFECVCDQLTNDTCDICPFNPAIQSRSFHGLLIYRNGTPYKWIDEPYTIKRYANESLQFLEQIPTPDQVTIALFQTPFSTMQGFVDSTFCQCSAGGVTYVAGPGIVISGDTIRAVDTSFTNELQRIDTLRIVSGVLQISLLNDGVPYSTVTLPVPDGSETNVTAGTGISVTGVGTIASPYVVTNTGDLSATNEAWTIDADDADTELIIAQTVKFQGAGIITTDYIPGTDILSINGTEVDGSVTNEAQTLSVSGTTSGILTLSTAGGAGGGTATIAAGTNIGVSQSGGTITINNTGAGALSGVVNQVPYFNTSTTITTEAGSGANSLTWDATNNYLGIMTATPAAALHVGGGGSIRINDAFKITTDGGNNGEFSTVGNGYFYGSVPIGSNPSGQPELSFTGNAVGIRTDSPLASLHVKGNMWVEKSSYGEVSRFQTEDANHSPVAVTVQANYGKIQTYGVGSGSGFLSLNPEGNNVGIWTATPAQTLHVQGTARITGSDGTATTVMGRDGDGDISALSLSGMSIVSGTLTATDGSTTNEIQTYGHAGTTTYTNTLSLSGGAWSITGAGIAAISHTGGAITVTATEVDGSLTNEAQTLSIGGTTTGTISLNAISGAGGGTATIAGGTGITVAQSGGTITITNSSPATAGWLLDGNTITTARRIGSNDNFDVVVETNGIDRMWFDNAGTASLGATQLTTAQFNISGLGSTNIGQLISGGSGLVAPSFYTATGSGSGSTATVFSGIVSMLSGNVESLVKNTATAGTNGGAVYTMNVSSTASTYDPFIRFQIDGVTDWSIGIDNDDVDNLKIHRFNRPSDNNGSGTIELGYNLTNTAIGMAINKTGIGIGTNGFYALDAQGKGRFDQWTNNSNVTTGTYALGNATGTGGTIDAAVTEFWGNGGRLKFTSGTSPTANGVICTITLDANFTFGECAPMIQARTTNASGFGYSGSFNSGTRVITFTLNGTLTASTVYEFNINFTGQN